MERDPSITIKTRPSSTNTKIPPPITVLYIDDEPVLLDPIRYYLERKGTFFVETATSAKSALDLIRKKPYDVIVSDYQMPFMDGIQLLKLLREENNSIPFIIFTGKGHEDVVVEAYNAGADFYIPKGGNPKALFLDLTQKITQIVTRRRSEVALLESEERYRKVVEQSHDAIFIYQQSRLVFVNDQVQKITGYAKEELLTMDIRDIIHKDDQKLLLECTKEQESGITIPQTYEARLLTKGGETRYLEIAVTPLAFKGIDSVLGSARDITERKMSEEALKKSEEKYRSIFNTFDDLYYQTDMKGIITTLSPSCKKITGWDASELIGHPVTDLYPFPEQRILLLDHIFEDGGVHDYEVILRNKKGEQLNVSVTSHVVRNEQGVPTAIEGSLRDITERIRFEKALHASEQRLHAIIDGSAFPLFVINRHHEILYWNQSLARYTGIAKADILGTADSWKAFYETPRPVLADILIDNNLPALDEYYKGKWTESKHTKGAYAATDFFPKIGTNGTWLHFTAVVIRDGQGEIIGALETLEDVTEQRKAEDELIAGEAYLKTIFNSVQTALVIIDPDTHRIFDLNPAAENLIGAGREDLIGTSCHQGICLVKEGRCPITDLNLRFENTEQLIITAAGTKKPVTKTIVPVTIAGKHYLLENILDITDRKLAEDAMQKAHFELERKVEERTAELSRLTESLRCEIAERNRVMEALRESKEKYRSLVEQTNDLIFHINADGLISYVSPNVISILGLPDTDVIGMSPTAFMTEDGKSVFVRLHEHNIRQKTPVSGIELSFYDQNKKQHIFEINGTPNIDNKGNFFGFSGVARDITDKKALQDEIAASLKEKEILLKEIHHRVKNNMQVISSLLSLQAKMVKDEKSRDIIKESQNRVISIAMVHEKLYQSKSLAQIDYSGYIRKMAENLLDSYNIQPGRVKLAIEADEIMLPISKAIPASLIINELLSNSLKYAFPNNRKGTIGVILKKEGDRHFLTVWDNGVGIPDGFRWDRTETLGLQLVTSLVGQLSGTMSFAGDKGTEFRIVFSLDAPAGEHDG